MINETEFVLISGGLIDSDEEPVEIKMRFTISDGMAVIEVVDNPNVSVGIDLFNNCLRALVWIPDSDGEPVYEQWYARDADEIGKLLEPEA